MLYSFIIPKFKTKEMTKKIQNNEIEENDLKYL
jgi:hypothetical protein